MGAATEKTLRDPSSFPTTLDKLPTILLWYDKYQRHTDLVNNFFILSIYFIGISDEGGKTRCPETQTGAAHRWTTPILIMDNASFT